MKRINLLDEDTSNKIAAGEVVEGPSSVVKELVENSIDANSKNIIIEIEEGGTSLIRIIDDGDGIYPDDMEKAFLPHATSKIKNSEDIYSLHTLGFRGEALPSVASVSKLNIKSKIEGNEFGKEISIEGGEIVLKQEFATNKGTTIEVKELFYNVPARKKFLKSVSREGSLITDLVNRIALSNPSISFKLFRDGKKVIHTYGNNNLKDALRTVYGKNISENLIYFESAEDKLTIYGYIGKEEIARGSRNNQSLFVNGRYVKHKTITAAVENAFKSFSTCNKFPFYILFIEVYPEFVDVNIHPTKAEIKFDDDRAMYGKVFHTVHDAFKKEVFDSFKIEDDVEVYKGPEVENVKMDFTPLEESQKVTVNLPIDLKSDSVYKEREEEAALNKPVSVFENKEIISTNVHSFNKITETEEDYAKSKLIEDEKHDENNDNTNNVVNEIKREAKFPPLRIIGQYNKTYVIGEYDEVLYLIDQHAAHEKILFEKYLKAIENGEIVVQPLLIPSILELTADDFCYYEENKEVFKTAGFTLEEFGGNTLALKEVPYFLGKLDPKSLFLNILDNLKQLGSGKTTEVKYNRIATMACKAAVKANNELSDMEMAKLIEDLRYIDDPFHCPHGRPNIIKFTNYDIEKMFRRIV